jgi:hypothetical protein
MSLDELLNLLHYQKYEYDVPLKFTLMTDKISIEEKKRTHTPTFNQVMFTFDAEAGEKKERK